MFLKFLGSAVTALPRFIPHRHRYTTMSRPSSCVTCGVEICQTVKARYLRWREGVADEHDESRDVY